MTPDPLSGLSRREREVLKALVASPGLLVEEVRERMPDPPTNSATRSILRGLLEKGRIRLERDGRSYRYHPVGVDDRSRMEALAETVRTFFGGSLVEAAAALVEVGDELDGTTRKREEAEILDALRRIVDEREDDA